MRVQVHEAGEWPAADPFSFTSVCQWTGVHVNSGKVTYRKD